MKIPADKAVRGKPYIPFRAENGTRTHDPFITSEVLYQLSYFSTWRAHTQPTNYIIKAKL